MNRDEEIETELEFGRVVGGTNLAPTTLRELRERTVVDEATQKLVYVHPGTNERVQLAERVAELTGTNAATRDLLNGRPADNISSKLSDKPVGYGVDLSQGGCPADLTPPEVLAAAKLRGRAQLSIRQKCKLMDYIGATAFDELPL